MPDFNPDCLGRYDFDAIARYARQRFLEGIDTVSLLAEAQTQHQREEIALVAMLQVEDEQISAIDLLCPYAETCAVTDCRQRLRQKLEQHLGSATPKP